jgi:hypothetical protein
VQSKISDARCVALVFREGRHCRNSPGNLAMFAAIRRASSRVIRGNWG